MKFKYKFSKLILIIFIAIYAISALSLVLNVIGLVNTFGNELANFYDYMKWAIGIIVPVLAVALITAILISSAYTLGDKALTVNFGFLKDKYGYADMEGVIKNVTTDKLFISFKDESTLKVVISPAAYDDFVTSLIKCDRRLTYKEYAEPIDKGEDKK